MDLPGLRRLRRRRPHRRQAEGRRPFGARNPHAPAFAAELLHPGCRRQARGMNLAMFRVMALELWRDRGALVMAFFLPPLVFLIFSAVFAGSTGENIKLSLAVADLAHTPASTRLAQALVHDTALRAEIV